MNVGKFVHPVYTTARRLPRKQKAVRLGLSSMVFVLTLVGIPAFENSTAQEFSRLPEMPETPSLDFEADSPPIGRTWKENETIVQAYEIWDARYCELTPKPFLCARCIRSDQQFVRIISLAKDASPFRQYECRPFTRPYLY